MLSYAAAVYRARWASFKGRPSVWMERESQVSIAR